MKAPRRFEDTGERGGDMTDSFVSDVIVHRNRYPLTVTQAGLSKQY